MYRAMKMNYQCEYNYCLDLCIHCAFWAMLFTVTLASEIMSFAVSGLLTFDIMHYSVSQFSYLVRQMHPC